MSKKNIDTSTFFPKEYMSSETKLKRYSDMVGTFAELKVDLNFGNKGNTHAAVVMANICKYSNDIIRVFANNFNGAVSNGSEYCEELKKFILKPNTKLHVIYENEPNEKSEGYQIIKEYSEKAEYKNRVIIKKTSGIILNQIKQVLEKFDIKLRDGKHFAIGDKGMFRLETDSDDFKAMASFNDEKVAGALIELFDNDFNTKLN